MSRGDMELEQLLAQVNRPGGSAQRLRIPAAPRLPIEDQCFVLNGFANGSAALSPAHLDRLRGIASNVIRSGIRQRRSSRTRVRAIDFAGHTDSAGPADYNNRLGMRRALAVRQALLGMLSGRYPFPLETFVSSLGEAQPVASDREPSGPPRNRRVEICIIRGLGTA